MFERRETVFAGKCDKPNSNNDENSVLGGGNRPLSLKEESSKIKFQNTVDFPRPPFILHSNPNFYDGLLALMTDGLTST